MEQAIIDQTIKALERNHFEVYLANDRQKARDIFFQEIFDKIKPTTISWGDSETMKATGILSEIKQRPDCILIRTFQDGYSRVQKTYWRRQALLADLFVTGTNALTRQGQLVNVDMVGNRVAGITFGPEHVVLFIGTNKITDNIEQAMEAYSHDSRPSQRHPPPSLAYPLPDDTNLHELPKCRPPVQHVDHHGKITPPKTNQNYPYQRIIRLKMRKTNFQITNHNSTKSRFSLIIFVTSKKNITISQILPKFVPEFIGL